MAKTSPTQRSLEHLRALGFHCWIVERWNPYARIRQDMFGWVDICCVSEKTGHLWVQTTTKSNMNARIEKARGNAALMAFKVAGGSLQVHGWVKRKGHWVVDAKELSISDILENHKILS
jgi:hypothetical protein